MAKEACLCLVSYERLFVIKLSNLKKQEVDVKGWTCLTPREFDLVLELPDRDLCPFEFDSKIYMAASNAPPRILRANFSWPIYEFSFEECSIGRAESLDDAPLPFLRSFIANTPGSGDVYLYMKSRVEDSSGFFYVLCSGSRVWKQLIAPPVISGPLVGNSMFVLHNNLFVSSDSCLARFDPIKETWSVEPAADNNLSNKVFAILVNYQNGRVALYQYLDMCFESIQPRVDVGARFNFVDLGNGMLCAILSGRLLDSKSDSSVLCFSVFTLSVLKDFAALQLTVGLLS